MRPIISTTATAKRLRLFRERQKRQVVVARVEIGPEFIVALRKRGVVGPNEKLDRGSIGEHAAAVIVLWAAER